MRYPHPVGAAVGRERRDVTSSSRGHQ
jgi:hypothetical protein